jgi:hypothetical protein
LYCIKHPNGEQYWFQDRSFQLALNNNKNFIIAGCALYIPDEMQIACDQKNISEKLDSIIVQKI